MTEAQQALFEEGWPMAQRIAAKYHRRLFWCGEKPDDFRQMAAIGLIIAARGFDPSRGVAFKAYAYPVIKERLIDQLRSGVFAFSRKGDDPNSHTYGVRILYEGLTGDGISETTLDLAGSVGADDPQFDRVADRQAIESIDRCLSSRREHQVLAALAEGKTQAQIARDWGTTKGNVSLVFERIRRKARRRFHAEIRALAA